jgi:predicted Zn-dependent protease
VTLLANAASEAEVAGQIAHAIGHVTSRHTPRMATRGQMASLSTVPLVFIGGWAHTHSEAAPVPVAFRKFQEAHEAEAESLAADWMAQAGWGDGTIETGAFPAMGERARAVLPSPKPPPSLRRPRP